MAADAISPATSEAAILGRPIRPDDGRLTAAAAEALLAIRFDRQEIDRMHELAVKHQQDKLTAEEKATMEMENDRRVSSLLDLVHSEARRSLKRQAVH